MNCVMYCITDIVIVPTQRFDEYVKVKNFLSFSLTITTDDVDDSSYQRAPILSSFLKTYTLRLCCEIKNNCKVTANSTITSIVDFRFT